VPHRVPAATCRAADDPALGAVLRMLEAQPGDNRSLPEFASAVHSTERTLMRRCQRDLGMTFAEWRQRLRVVRAMPLLEAGQTVETIALDLGYGSASAFITMFKKMTGSTPDELRKAPTPDTRDWAFTRRPVRRRNGFPPACGIPTVSCP